MADKIIRVLAKDAPVKASAITAKEMVERARQIHKTLPVATAALGRSLMAASMMGNQLKEKDGSVTLRIKGGGPLGGITVVSDSQGNARGYVVNPLVDLPLKGPAKLDVGDKITLTGRLQSRAYQKQMPDGSVIEKTAYEVSVGHLELLDGAHNADPAQAHPAHAFHAEAAQPQ